MKKLNRLPLMLILTVGMVSCITTNNFYVNNPIPLGQGNNEVYLGIGSGLEAITDTGTVNGKTIFSRSIAKVPNLSGTFQVGLTDKTDLRLAFHFPKLIGGACLRLGLQHSFFDADSKINMALGADFGVAQTKWANILEAKQSVNMDFYLPIAYKTKNDFRLIVTPRYSYNSFLFPTYTGTEKFKVAYPVITLGLRKKYLYFETSALLYKDKVYPQFGFAYMIYSFD